MARLAALLLAFAVAVSATALAHGRDLPTQIKLTKGGAVVGGDSQECVYTVYVRTGAIWKAGTDANITLELYTAGNADGAHHGWYCNYVEVTVTGPHRGCAQQLFTVEQWLATDAAPYKLEAVVDRCPADGAADA
ncbi:hypothetical protein CFC21_089176 [Triticum aestivum]|uniref:PLAT domain-containing protein n=3 Tax=Triticum TaxID=4564 RepID=A0A9R0YUA5_TRITD|nr:hypothetical protein CFC21_089176 [Triticum aestivum]VAI60652.1 unnamed protein product [Triticum turgidum subsp. durum]